MIENAEEQQLERRIQNRIDKIDVDHHWIQCYRHSAKIISSMYAIAYNELVEALGQEAGAQLAPAILRHVVAAAEQEGNAILADVKLKVVAEREQAEIDRQLREREERLRENGVPPSQPW